MNSIDNFSPSRTSNWSIGRVFSGNVNIAIANTEAVLNTNDGFANGGRMIKGDIQTVPSKWFFLYNMNIAGQTSNY